MRQSKGCIDEAPIRQMEGIFQERSSCSDVQRQVGIDVHTLAYSLQIVKMLVV